MSGSIFDFLCIGSITLDLNTVAGRSIRAIGGSAYYTSLILARLGCRVALVSRVGRELKHVEEKLNSAGVYVAKLDVLDCKPIQFENIYDSSGRRVQRVSCELPPITVEDLPDIEARCIHICPTIGDVDVSVVEWASERSFTSIDIQGFLREADEQRVVKLTYSSGAMKAVRLSNFVKADLDEARCLTGEKTAAEAACALAGDRRIGAVTMGAEGSVICWRKPMRIPAYRARRVVDPTGAGDAYAAGFLYSLVYRGASIAESGHVASAVASFLVEDWGASCSFTWKEVERRIRGNYDKTLLRTR
ncbi:MAG: hypothetical protein DRN96_01150 [Thermoproteota archaeon]|nr:MAG: hypothetical protein DRN96_01150 [Candidatus Korarchaeota archaeon]RLG53471.1 MAG: hypothetical protein DRN99_06640 [Candidatus Korarchaeota archaeon]